MTINLTTFDAADYLDTPAALTAYLEDALADSDPAEFQHALGVVARAKGMTAVAAQAGLARGALYRALSANGHPEFSTIVRVLHALGLSVHFSVAANGNDPPHAHGRELCEA